MAFALKDRVRQVTTTTGTGTVTLSGSEAGFLTFSQALSDGDTTYYGIVGGNDYEIGLGTFTASGTTLSRDTILASSNSGAAVDFAAGDKQVFITYPAEKAIYREASGDVEIPSTMSVGSYIDLTPITHPTHSEGRVYYDSIHKTLNFNSDILDVRHEIGLEEHVRVYNNSGSTIAKGLPVYFSGNFNGLPTIGLGDATDVDKYNVQGLTAGSIADSSYGYVIVSGVVDDIDTSSLSAGDNFFVGLTPGALQNASPTYPNYPMCLGWVVKSDATEGIVLVNQQNHSVNSFRVRGDTHLGADVIIDGDLTVNGTQTVASSENISIGGAFNYLNAGDTIGADNTTFTGTGLDDGVLKGHYNGTTTNKGFYVRIDGTGTPDTFEWSHNSDLSSPQATGVAITGAEQTLADGISIEFGATTGHTSGDKWGGTASPANVDTGFASNRNTGSTGVGYTHLGFYYDVSDNKFKMFDRYDPEPTGTINTGDASFELGDLDVAALSASSANISGNITVSGTVDGRDIASDGATLDTALQPSDNISELTNDSGYITGITSGNVTTALGYVPIDPSGDTMTGNLNFNDGYAARFGNGLDLQIYHVAGSYNAIQSNGLLYIGNDSTTYITSVDGLKTAAQFFPSTAQRLYYNGALKFTTSTTGINVTGTAQADSFKLLDNEKLVCGLSSDLEIFHNGTNSVISDVGSGALSLQSNGTEVNVWDSSNTQYMAQFVTGGAVSLRYNGSIKLATSNSGVTVTGDLTVGSVTYPGTDGTDGQVLTTDGAGNLTFEDASSGGVTTGKAIAMAIVFGG